MTVYPECVELTDVCLRDGLQNLETPIPTEKKIVLAEKLIEAGFNSMELCSFVSPKWIPQMADAANVVETVKKLDKAHKVRFIALIPNLKGMERAVASGVDAVTYVISVSERHNINNVNRSCAESFAQIKELKKIQPQEMTLCLALATSFGCPYGENISPECVLNAVRTGLEFGADEIMLADTIGAANPAMIERVLEAVLKFLPPDRLKLHLHDTRGLAMANYLVAAQMGIYRFEASAGGLGGCPYAPGATGNAASEDLNCMFTEMGIKTGVNQEKLLKAVAYIDSILPGCTTSSNWKRISGAPMRISCGA